MAATPVALAPRKIRPVPLWAVFASATLAAGVLYAWMRLGVGMSIPRGYLAFCERLGLLPQDWPCRADPFWTASAYVGGSLLVGAGLLLPCLILAAAGRRSFLAPLAAAGIWMLAAATLGTGDGSAAAVVPHLGVIEPSMVWGDPDRGFWADRYVWSIVVDVGLLAIPVIAAWVAWGGRRRHDASTEPVGSAPGTRAITLAGLGCASGIGAVLWLTEHTERLLLFTTDRGLPVAIVIVFTLALGTDRRWWPWSLVPVAILASTAPAFVAIGSMSGYAFLAPFWLVVELVAVGLIASGLVPLARLLDRRRSSAPTSRGAVAPGPSSRVRPTVVANALSAGLVLATVFAAAFDPGAIGVSTTLPTFLGIRVAAQDARAAANLDLALGALGAYRAEHGSSDGFDAAAGASLAPDVAWVDGLPTDELAVGVYRDGGAVQMLVHSGSGAALCGQMRDGRTYGSVPAPNGGPTRAARSAIAICGAEPLTQTDTRPPDVGSLCKGVDDGAIMLCRRVQDLVDQVSTSPTAVSIYG